MASEKLTKWANSGTKTAPTGSKINTGWINDEQVPYEWLNWLQDRVEEKVNEVLEERLNSWYDGASDWKHMVASGVWDDSWASANETGNTISAGSTKKIIDVAGYVNSTGESRLLLLDQVNTKIEVWNPRTLTSIRVSDDLSNDLPTGGGQTWEVYSFCTDGTNVYAMFRDTNASPDTHQVQAWVISESSSNWAIVSGGWGSTGQALTGTGNTSISGSRDGKIIVADDNNLAMFCGWNSITSSASAAIQIIAKDNSAGAYGAGDAPTGGTFSAVKDLCSDGTYIYFMAIDGTNDLRLCSSTIATPTSGCGGTNFANPGGYTLASSYFGTLTSCGPNMICTAIAGTSVTAGQDFLYVSNSGDADLQMFTYGRNAEASPLATSDYVMEAPLESVFDGINLWLYGKITPSGGDMTVLVKIDTARLFTFDLNHDLQINDAIVGVYALPPDYEIPPAGAANWTYVTCTFDGRDIWCNPEPRASQTLSGKVFRLPLALLRG